MRKNIKKNQARRNHSERLAEINNLIDYLLTGPISIRSHFLPSAPLIALGSRLPQTKKYNLSFLYTLLHEYLHFEDYTYWPFTVMGYLRNCIGSLNALYNCRGNIRNTKPIHDPHSNAYIPLRTQIALQSKETFLIKGGIGADMLLEASALLNYRLKPKGTNSLYTISDSIINELSNGPINQMNLTHTVGVRLVLKAVEGLQGAYSNYIENKMTGAEKQLFNELSATLPSLIARNTFGYSLIINGFFEEKFEWNSVFDFVLHNYRKIQDTYISKVKQIYHDVLLNKKYDEFLNIVFLRDLSILAYHSYMTISHNMIYAHASKLYPTNHKINYLYTAPILNLLKLHEALNAITLSKYNIPILKGHWVSIPVIFFPEKGLSAVRIDFETRPGFFVFRWADSLSYENLEYHYLYSWIRMAFTDSLFNAIKSELEEFNCPIWCWVKGQYGALGEVDPRFTEQFLIEFCNSSMACDFDIRALHGHIQPSETYCKSTLFNSSKLKSSELCFFHQNINACFTDA